MKRNCSTRSAFFVPRILIGLLLTTVSVVLAVFAFGLTPLDDSESQTHNSGWVTRSASAFGVHLDSQQFAAPEVRRCGGGAPTSKRSGDPIQAAAQSTTSPAYTSPRNNLRPVRRLR